MFALLLAATIASSPPPAGTVDPALDAILARVGDGHAVPSDLADANAYVQAHPSDADGLAVRCIVKNELASGQNPIGPSSEDCRTALKMAPQDPFVHYAYADQLYDAGQWADSLREYTQAIQLGLTGRGVYWKRCDAYRRSGNLDAALADCNAQLAEGPSFWGYYARGHLYVERKEYANAITDLTAALALRPQDVNALYWRGLAHLQSDSAQDADADFSRCIELGDSSGDTYYYRGWARVSLKNKAGAQSDWQTAVKVYQANGMGIQASIVQALLKKLPTL